MVTAICINEALLGQLTEFEAAVMQVKRMVTGLLRRLMTDG
jgi:hypothetical protein